MDFPNATHSIFVEDEIVDLVVESKNLKIEDDIFNSDINLLDGDSLVFSARAILLIDPVFRLTAIYILYITSVVPPIRQINPKKTSANLRTNLIIDYFLPSFVYFMNFSTSFLYPTTIRLSVRFIT